METLPEVKNGDRVLEIVHQQTGEIVHRSVVTDQPESYIEKLERGMLMRVDMDNWFVADRVVGGED